MEPAQEPVGVGSGPHGGEARTDAGLPVDQGPVAVERRPAIRHGPSLRTRDQRMPVSTRRSTSSIASPMVTVRGVEVEGMPLVTAVTVYVPDGRESV